MSITQSQLNELKTAHNCNPDNGLVNDLIEKWGAEIFLRESRKDGNTAFTLKALKGEDQRQVTGIKIAESFCFHKDAWGGSFWVLTHMQSGIKTLSGKKSTLSKVIKDFAQWEGIPVLDKAMNENGLQALSKLSDATIQEYRKFYEDAGY